MMASESVRKVLEAKKPAIIFQNDFQSETLPHIRFHELRNSTAINPLSRGFSLKNVQKWLGHSDIKTTANIYGHPDAKRKMALAG